MFEELKQLSKPDLIKQWNKYVKSEPPKHAQKDYLIKHIIWHMQAEKYGGYSPQTIKQLEKLARKLKNKSEIKEADIKNSSKQLIGIKSGTKLIREFKGVKYEVIALDKGFEYKGKEYRSLSAIANEITGSRWNGKIFFGVKNA